MLCMIKHSIISLDTCTFDSENSYSDPLPQKCYRTEVGFIICHFYIYIPTDSLKLIWYCSVSHNICYLVHKVKLKIQGVLFWQKKIVKESRMKYLCKTTYSFKSPLEIRWEMYLLFPQTRWFFIASLDHHIEWCPSFKGYLSLTLPLNLDLLRKSCLLGSQIRKRLFFTHVAAKPP